MLLICNNHYYITWFLCLFLSLKFQSQWIMDKKLSSLKCNLILTIIFVFRIMELNCRYVQLSTVKLQFLCTICYNKCHILYIGMDETMYSFVMNYRFLCNKSHFFCCVCHWPKYIKSHLTSPISIPLQLKGGFKLVLAEYH